ncbi:MAG: Regulator of competence-specific s, partial [Conexibacter sp.]|nr:Regulator of competence-specific s [Conexibacter sp.]
RGTTEPRLSRLSRPSTFVGPGGVDGAGLHAVRFAPMAERLEDVVNIGPALAHDLRAVGVADLATLRAVGAQEAWVRMHAAGCQDCLSSLLALEGAVRGVGWMQISAGDRDAVVTSARAKLEGQPAATSSPA